MSRTYGGSGAAPCRLASGIAARATSRSSAGPGFLATRSRSISPPPASEKDSTLLRRGNWPASVSRAGLVPVMAPAQRCGLADLAGEHVTIASPAGVNPGLKIPCWSRAWPPGRITSMTWTSCGTAP